jgi:ketose-bisphosphate aldolase
MKPLRKIIQEAEKNKTAIGHFNISDTTALKAVFEGAKTLGIPVIIGVSEGEREFIGTRQATALIKSLRDEFDYSIYLNADHTKSLEKLKEAVEAGFDSAVFDMSESPLEENIKKTKEAVEYAKSIRPDFLIEGELGYIGSGSIVLKEIPIGAAIKLEDLTKPEEAARFVKETGVDLLAPAVGNIHGILRDAPQPNLNIERIKEIKNAVAIPLVLHGGSGIKDEELLAAMDAGISIIHINTELRIAWRKGIEKALMENPEETTPYKLLPFAVEEIKKVVLNKLKLFNRQQKL